MHPKDLLSQHDLRPKKSLGQNFLFDENVLGRIVEAADLSPDEAVLEIGPGLGSLTKLLAETAVRVVAVELDERFFPILEAELGEADNVTLVHGDILEQEPGQWFGRAYAVVANVPYYITGAILRHLLEGELRPSRLVLTVQQEVADRLTAAPPDMSLLALSVGYYGTVTQEASIKAGSFWPRPDVDSAVIRIDVTQPPPDSAEAKLFFRLARAAFSQKRKQLQKNLRQVGMSKEEVRRMLAEAGIDGRRRAETLGVAEWRELTAVYRARLRSDET